MFHISHHTITHCTVAILGISTLRRDAVLANDQYVYFTASVRHLLRVAIPVLQDGVSLGHAVLSAGLISKGEPKGMWLAPHFDPPSKKICYVDRQGTLRHSTHIARLAPSSLNRALFELLLAEKLIDAIPGPLLKNASTAIL